MNIGLQKFLFLFLVTAVAEPCLIDFEHFRITAPVNIVAVLALELRKRCMRILLLEGLFRVEVTDEAYPFLVGLQEIKLVFRRVRIMTRGTPFVPDRLVKIFDLHEF
jgi:hypothetical protein